MHIFACMKIKDLDEAADTVCEMMNLLSNRNRLMILCHLVEGERSVGELAELLGVREAVISQHLAILRRDQVVKATRDGQTMNYKITSKDVKKLLNFLYKTYCGSAA